MDLTCQFYNCFFPLYLSNSINSNRNEIGKIKILLQFTGLVDPDARSIPSIIMIYKISTIPMSNWYNGYVVNNTVSLLTLLSWIL